MTLFNIYDFVANTDKIPVNYSTNNTRNIKGTDLILAECIGLQMTNTAHVNKLTNNN